MRKILIHGANSDIAYEFIKLSKTRYDEYHLFIKSEQKHSYEFISSAKIFIYRADLKSLEKTMEALNNLPNDITDIFWVSGYTGDSILEASDSKAILENVNINFLNVVISINEILLNKFKIINHKQHICVITSVAGLRGRKKNLFYGASKSGLISYLSGLRQKYKEKINICTVIPGYINTQEFRKLKTISPNFLITEPSECAKIIMKSLDKNKEIVFIDYKWRIIMFFLRLIPEKIFKKLDF